MKSVIYFEDDTVLFNSRKITTIHSTFLKGIYQAVKNQRKNTLDVSLKKLDEVIQPLGSPETLQVLDTVQRFFDPTNRETINACGFLHKLGILLYGKQGTGKTSIYKYIIQQSVAEHDAICFIVNGLDSLFGAVTMMQQIRKVQDNPIILLIDEIEAYTDRNEHAIKELLDGSNSVDNLLVLSSTNYICKIPSTIKDRPSRFKMVLEFKAIRELSQMIHVAKEILKGRFGITDEQLYDVFSTRKETTLDEIKHVIQDLIMGTKFTFEKRTIGFIATKKRNRAFTN